MMAGVAFGIAAVTLAAAWVAAAHTIRRALGGTPPPDAAIREDRSVARCEAIWQLTDDSPDARERISLLVWEMAWNEAVR